MKCPSCSTEIADKAIVCYRCGAPTAVNMPAPPKPARRHRGRRLLVLLAVLAALVVLWLYTLAQRAG